MISRRAISKRKKSTQMAEFWAIGSQKQEYWNAISRYLSSLRFHAAMKASFEELEIVKAMRTSHDYDRTGYCRQCGAYDKDMVPNCSKPTGERVNGNFDVHTVTSAPDATISLGIGPVDKAGLTDVEASTIDQFAELRKEVTFAVRSVMLEEEVAKLRAENAALRGKYRLAELLAETEASPIDNALTAMHRQFVAGDLAARFEPDIAERD
jgi:hypothetical protein